MDCRDEADTSGTDGGGRAGDDWGGVSALRGMGGIGGIDSGIGSAGDA